MGAREIRDATDQVMDEEATALAQILATEGRCAMVIVIVAENDEHGTTRLGHGVGGETKGAHLLQFIAATERQLAWLKAKLHRG